jgi:hypothetical protein
MAKYFQPENSKDKAIIRLEALPEPVLLELVGPHLAVVELVVVVAAEVVALELAAEVAVELLVDHHLLMADRRHYWGSL